MEEKEVLDLSGEDFEGSESVKNSSKFVLRKSLVFSDEDFDFDFDISKLE